MITEDKRKSSPGRLHRLARLYNWNACDMVSTRLSVGTRRRKAQTRSTGRAAVIQLVVHEKYEGIQERYRKLLKPEGGEI
jgi:hypothetical protein